MECEYDVDVPIGRVTSTVVPSGRGVAGSKKRYSVLRVAFGPYEVRFCGRGTDLALLYEVGNRGKPRSPFPLPPHPCVSRVLTLTLPPRLTHPIISHQDNFLPSTKHHPSLYAPCRAVSSPALAVASLPCLHVAVPTISSHLQYYFHFITLLRLLL